MPFEELREFTNVGDIHWLTVVRHNGRSLIKAIDSVGDPPLPIPNREVKPNSADGTAKICGRVGHRHFYRKDIQFWVSFFVYTSVNVLLSWRCRLFGDPPGTHFVRATCDLSPPAPTNLLYRYWQSLLIASHAVWLCHTSRDYPLQGLSNLLSGLWESSGLKALLWGAKAPVVASIATVSQCHRHFLWKDEFQKDSSFCI